MVGSIAGTWTSLAAAAVFHDVALYLAIVTSIIGIASGILSIKRQLKQNKKEQ